MITIPLSYNTGSTIGGTTQVGGLAIGTTEQDYSSNIGGVKWWMGPDQDLGYVIAHPVSGNTQSTPVFSGAPSGKLTLSPTYIGDSMNLSNGNQTVIQYFGYVQSVLGQTLVNNNDKVMFSVFCSLLEPATFPNGHYIGVGTTSMNYNVVSPNPYNSFPGNDNQSVGLNSGGEYWYNGSLQSSGLPTWTSGDTIDVAVSLIDNKIWIRVNGGNWNNSPTDNPTTSSGGQNILGGLTSFYPVLCPAYEGTMTILNTTTYGVPSGYTLLGANINASVGFNRTKDFTDGSFISLAEYVSRKYSTPQTFSTASQASLWLTTNGFWNSYVTNCLNIATNNGGGLTGWNPTAFDIAPNPAIGTTYPVGSQITFQNGEVRTMVQVDDYSPIYMDIFYDSPISTNILFPITICYP